MPVYFYWTGQRFDFANYLAIASAALHTNGQVVVHVDDGPVDNPHFDRLRTHGNVSIEPLRPRDLMSDEHAALYRRLIFPAHRADLVRFCTLYEFGGLSLDTDTVVRRSLDDLPARLLLTDNKVVYVGTLALPSGDPLAGRMLAELLTVPDDDLARYPSIVHRWTQVVRDAGDSVPFGDADAFFPVHWQDWESIFQPGGWTTDVESIHVLHHYGYFSRTITADMNEQWLAEHPCLFTTVATPVVRALAAAEYPR